MGGGPGASAQPSPYRSKLKLAIELDGGQHADNPADAERTRMIEAHGYRVIPFWNSDGVLQEILQEIALARGE